MRVGVIDYGIGNLGSMLRALEELGAQPSLITGPDQLLAAERLILPGVGNFTDSMTMLDAGGWTPALKAAVRERNRPLLGVCVGMQLLAEAGDEGAAGPEGTPGLGFIRGRVRHLRSLGCNARVPHVGWNSITARAPKSALLGGIPDGTDFYFVHSYALSAGNPADVIATTPYGIDVTAAVQNGKVWGTQFHPEKSSRAGFRLLRNFVGGAGC